MNFSDILTIIAIGASPISELRGAIPIAVGVHGFPWYYAFLFAVIGNLIPIPFILLFLDRLVPLLSKVHSLDRLIQWFFARTRRKGKIFERYQKIGLALFVAVPLPITGAWTGSILAVILGLKFKYAFLSIAAGVLIAGVIVTCATMLGWTVAGIFKEAG